MTRKYDDQTSIYVMVLIITCLFVLFVFLNAPYKEEQKRRAEIDKYLQDVRIHQVLYEVDLELNNDSNILDSIKRIPSPTKCLTDNIYYESAFEPYEGRLAVAQVTLNRAGTPANVCKVVYFKKVNKVTGKKEAAFSWTLGKKWKAKGMNKKRYRECYMLARAVLTKHVHSAMIDSSVKYYHRADMVARWDENYTMVAQIGDHVFFK